MTTTRDIAITLALLATMGCATPRSAELSNQELQGRVLHLENLAQQRDQELAQLREDVDAERQARQALEQPAGGAGAATHAATDRMTLRDVQTALKRAGFDPGPADGKMGKQTRQALRNFQQAQGLAADGRIGPQTMVKLKPYLNPATSGEK